LTFQGGVNTGKTVQDICGPRSQLPEFTIVAELAKSGSRQESGFGSTGIEAACPDSLPG